MNDFEERFSSAWPARAWNDLAVVVAVSGGGDSVALLRALLATRATGSGRLIVAHFNHHWRGDRSVADANFVRLLAGEFGLACQMGSAPIDPKRRDEASARRLRYKFLQTTAESLGARYVAVGHTADDQAETVLHRIVRGTGISGLAGIPRTRRLGQATTLIRPMLSFRRHEVESYLAALDQPFCQDDTNQDRRFTRNRIRHELIPFIERHFQSDAVTALNRLGGLASETQDFLTSHVEEATHDCVIRKTPREVVVDRQRLAKHHSVVIQEFLLSLWKQQNWPRQEMGREQWLELRDMVQGDRQAPCTLPGQIRVCWSSQHLQLVDQRR